MMVESFHFRPFAHKDFPRVQEIYRQGIDTGLATFETEVKDWTQWQQAYLPDCQWVLEFEGTVLGWATLSKVSSRAVYRGVAEVTLYIASEAKGKGLGFQLLSEVVNESEQKGFWTLQAAIFSENLASINLHAKAGFRQVGIRKKLGALRGEWKDVVLMERRSKLV